ncbi:GTP-binding protein [Trypanosoma brucei equiperdum]|uniref:GTP-binding protein n=1 Tax=Trypanosoma brucei equiperdum TaxID=630700 RepID=A0A3L6LAP5_9TRYP|nr:GTP-binding protein [Trypanosoma brucei equiperdum]
MQSLGRSIQRSKQAAQRSSRTKYRQMMEAERNAAMVREMEEQEHQRRKGAPLKSIWETNNLEEFLLIADAQEKGYEAARDLHLVVDGTPHVVTNDKVLPLSDDRVDWLKISELLTIPRRPQWSYDMTAQEVQSLEASAFFEWRRRLAQLEEKHKVVMTPYEKNLEVWRQLWRVTERADIVLMILDARNPLVFRCADFELSVRETMGKAGKPKEVVFLLNKSDLLTEEQRRVWADYFTERGEAFIFFSATPSDSKKKESVHCAGVDGESEHDGSEGVASDHMTGSAGIGAEREVTTLGNDEDEDLFSVDNEKDFSKLMRNKKEKRRHNKKSLRAPVVVANPYQLIHQRKVCKEQLILRKQQPQNLNRPPQPLTADEKARDDRVSKLSSLDPWAVLDPEQLLDRLAMWRKSCSITDTETPLMVGLVGYPNVGKSSTINAILGCKKVVVSATPGKTKHFQTLVIPNERRVALCDCPGLVFPSFASTRAQMVCDGILPIDTATDVEAAIAILCQRIPRQVLEQQFNVSLRAGDDRDESHSLMERLLNAVARRRGYLGAHDRPNRSRAGRDILKLYVDGVLLYVEPPPSYHPHVSDIAAYVSQYKGKEGVIVDKSKRDSNHSVTEADLDGASEGDGDEWEDASSCASDLDDYDAEAWEALDRAAADRALSDADSVGSRDLEGDNGVADMAVPKFYVRPKGACGTLTRQEALNAEANVKRILMGMKNAARRRRRTNHQLDPADDVFINAEGEVELIIDDDDGIVEIGGASPCGKGGSSPRAVQAVENTKKMSKRQMRRELKRSGVGPVNPTTRRQVVQGY